MLRSMLTCHSRIAIPRASHFVVEIHQKFAKRDLSSRTNRDQVVNWLLVHERVADFEIDAAKARQKMLNLESPSLAGYCRIVFEEYASLKGKPRWGDKTTTYGPHTKLLAQMFPDAQFVHLHRDGRDVVSSLMSVPWGNSNVIDGTLTWRSDVEAIHRAGHSLSASRYIEIAYEALVEHPSKTLKTLCSFLGEQFEPQMLEYMLKVDELILPRDRPYHRHLAEKPSPGLIYKWKREMSEQDRAVVEYLSGKHLRRLGYEISGARMDLGVRAAVRKRLSRRCISATLSKLLSVPIPYTTTIRKVARRTVDYFHRDRMKAVFARPTQSLDRQAHIREALGWLCRAQDAGMDGGIARGVIIGAGVFQASYPETTGYIIPTMIEASRVYSEPEYFDRAIQMGDWEAEIQMESGAVMAGRVGCHPIPAVFNTGQVMLGWNALFESTGEERFISASRRSADWLVEIQEPSGNWVKGNSPLAAPNSTVYNMRVAWALAQTGILLDSEAYVQAAKRFIDFSLDYQQENGWIANCCLSNPEQPLLHTLAYATRGLLETGRLLQQPDYIHRARITADALLRTIDGEGFLAGRFNSCWGGTVAWCCLTGSAQASIILSILAEHTGDPAYARGARSINQYLMRRHDITNRDPTLRGGVYGSWPVNGDYCRFEILNWATKFCVDALLREEELSECAEGVPGRQSGYLQ